MKYFYFSIFVFLFATISAFADGTKQLMPPQENGTAKGVCCIALGQSQSLAFGRYYETSNGITRAPETDRIYIRILNTNEEIHFGISNSIFLDQQTNITLSALNKLNYRIINPMGNPVQTGNLKTTTKGIITSYSEAIAGPKKTINGSLINANGYESISYAITSIADTGNYCIEFDIGTQLTSDSKIIDFDYFDISVINTQELKQIDGRVWAYEWGLSPKSFKNEVWSTFYTRSNDKYTSKVYFAGPQPYRFILGCNSFGATDEYTTAEENRQSYPNKNTFKPEYRVFLTRPNDDEWGGAAVPPNVPDKLQLAGDAITCEDLIFVVQLLNTEDATVELYIDGANNGEGVDKVLVEKLEAAKNKKGYHYPWKNQTTISNAGYHYYTPTTTDACPRQYKLSLFDQRFKLAGNDDTYNIGDTTFTSEIIATNIEWSYSGGLGTENNPILINNKSELEKLSAAVKDGTAYQYVINNFYYIHDNGINTPYPLTFTIENTNGFNGVHFYLTAPTGTITLNDSWEPIGTKEHPFQGTLRCGRYEPNPTTNPSTALAGDQDTITITGIKGLFGYCKNATIDNIHLKGGGISIGQTNTSTFIDNENSSSSTFGSICNYAENTKFSHCSSNILLQGNADYVGGILGYGKECTLDSCYNYGKIQITESLAIGGIAGGLEQSNINFCYNLNYIKTNITAGGIVGQLDGSTSKITNCRNDGTVETTDLSYNPADPNDDFSSAGGIVGYTYANFSIDGCSNSGMIYGYESGSIIGSEDDNISGTISHCNNTGSVRLDYTTFGPRCSEVTYSVATGENVYYVKENGCSKTEGTPTPEEMGTSSKGYYYFFIDDNNDIGLLNTFCCGRTWRMEDAGRLFNDDKSYYMAWDGKDDNGECISGEITVDYHKNSGITHFPFFDPENIQHSDNPLMRGMVAYRISPIKEGETTIGLPLNYYQTNTASTEQGYELNLFWDDRKISYNSKCDFETKNVNGTEFIYGKTTTTGTTVEKKYCTNVSNCSVTTQNITKTYYRCNDAKSSFEGDEESGKIEIEEQVYKQTGVNKKGNPTYGYVTEKFTYYESYTGQCSKGNLKTYSKKYSYCSKKGYYYKESTDCIVQTTIEGGKTVCQGITNVEQGGYPGTTGGGHIFPIVNSSYGNDGFGNSNTMNTWWNGVETVGKSILILQENEPAVLMPIVISKWIVTNQTNSVLLEWRTSSENNNDFFTIERSYDGVHWTKIGKISGAGTTSISHDYSFVDYEPLDGISYYRIKQTDFNGEYSYSSIKCINRIAENKNAFKAYTKKNANEFIIEGKEIAACTIELYDTMGRKVTNVSYTTVDTDKVVISVNKLNAGTYIIKSCNQAKTIVKNW